MEALNVRTSFGRARSSALSWLRSFLTIPIVAARPASDKWGDLLPPLPPLPPLLYNRQPIRGGGGGRSVDFGRADRAHRASWVRVRSQDRDERTPAISLAKWARQEHLDEGHQADLWRSEVEGGGRSRGSGSAREQAQDRRSVGALVRFLLGRLARVWLFGRLC